MGGRSTTVLTYGDSEPVELGASIFVEVNEILRNRSIEFGLRPKEPETETQELLGIWDGTNFVFTQEEAAGWKGYWNLAKLFVGVIHTSTMCFKCQWKCHLHRATYSPEPRSSPGADS